MDGKGGRRLRTTSGRRDSCLPPLDSLGGWPQRPPDGHPFRRSEGSRPLCPPVAVADSLTVRLVDIRGVVERIRTSECMTTLVLVQDWMQILSFAFSQFLPFTLATMQ
jgi:hypothetical protein